MTRSLGLIIYAIVLVGLAVPSQAALHSYSAFLDGLSESPPNASPGTGNAQVDYDDAAHTLHVNVSFSGLIGTTSAAHIHSPTAVPLSGNAGVATSVPTFAGFPLGVTSGIYDNILDLTMSSSWNPAFITANGGTTSAAEEALASSLAAGRAYLNIHSTFSAGGEIRGFLVPEPTTVSLVAVGALSLLRRRRRMAI